VRLFTVQSLKAGSQAYYFGGELRTAELSLLKFAETVLVLTEFWRQSTNFVRGQQLPSNPCYVTGYVINVAYGAFKLPCWSQWGLRLSLNLRQKMARNRKRKAKKD